MKSYLINDINIYQYIFEFLDSNMYIIINGVEAIVIDPHKNVEAIKVLKEKGVSKVWILLTHEHTDHTSGIYIFQDNFKCTLICQEDCGKHICNPRSQRPLLIYFTLEERDHLYGTNLLEIFKQEYVPNTYTADITYSDEKHMHIIGLDVWLKHIPGHSKGSNIIIINDSFVFTGDSLMNDNPIITRFPGSDHKKYVNYTLPILESLDRNLYVFPGHGFGFTLDSMYKEGKLHIEYK